jgi:hypothetical protein
MCAAKAAGRPYRRYACDPDGRALPAADLLVAAGAR